MDKKAETAAFQMCLQIFGKDMNIRDTVSAVAKARTSLEMKEHKCGSIGSLHTARGLNSRWLKKQRQSKLAFSLLLFDFIEDTLLRLMLRPEKASLPR
eukprot:9171228-Ditylum_brightwellii.AAC.1